MSTKLRKTAEQKWQVWELYLSVRDCVEIGKGVKEKINIMNQEIAVESVASLPQNQQLSQGQETLGRHISNLKRLN